MSGAATLATRDYELRPGPRLVVGPGSLRRLGSLAHDLGATRALVASDPGIVAAGHTAAAVESLAAAGLTTAVFSAFGENPTTDHVAAGAEFARAFRPDLIVGLGGGSSMDCAKGINFLVSCGGRMQDYRGRDSTPAAMLPSIAVPTTAGTGSETQSFALVTDPATGMKMACGAAGAAFRVAILDVNLTLTQPLSLVALTGIDAVSHAVESHVSRAATPASRMFSREAFRLLATNLPGVFADGGTIAARAEVQFGAALAGLAIENSMLGAAHALANPLTATHHVPHGQAVGLALPHVVRFNGPACGDVYADLLAAIGVECPADAAGECLAAWLADLLARSRLATTLAAARVVAPNVCLLATQAAAQWTAGFNPRPVDADDLARLYEAAR
ncbi:MAG: iron-containing alcohol dehydrogenase [Planctomycetia bacterium]|nr:iron-containing alcohol dehydrogenase [Planctomycetia bacterium]